MNILFILVALVALFLALKAVAFFRREEREKKDIDDSNPYLHPELAEKLLSPEMAVYVRVARPDEHDEHGKHNSDEQHSRPSSLSGLSSSTSPTKRGNERGNEKGSNKRNRRNVYEAFLKPILDNILSFLGLLLLSPVFIIVIIAIKVDDPGPVFFTQCRITRDKKFFRLHKFRSMKMSTPHDMPTHLLANPEQYITRVGRFLRRSSLDELPQIWDIFRGKMSVVGPRPALWNQADLIAERDRWGANDIKPGLTGLAQISGRDQLEIKDKAELDGIYTQQIMKSSISGFSVDIRCFFGTLLPVLRSEGIVEGKKKIIEEKSLMEEKCPKCGRIYMCPPALSREDNKTDICPVCGTIEALDAWPFISEEGRRQVIEVTEKAEIENGRVKPLCKKDTDSRNKQ